MKERKIKYLSIDNAQEFDLYKIGSKLQAADYLFPSDEYKSELALFIVDELSNNDFDFKKTKISIMLWEDSSLKDDTLSIFDEVMNRIKILQFPPSE